MRSGAGTDDLEDRKIMSRDYRDFIGGLILTALGLWVAWYASGHYNMGTLRRMGEGMFPVALGVILAGFGLAIAIPALFRRGDRVYPAWFTALCVSAGVAGFALLVRPFGLIPAILAVVIISSVAELKFRPLSLAVLCASLCLLAYLVFRVGLGLPIPMFRWPY